MPGMRTSTGATSAATVRSSSGVLPLGPRLPHMVIGNRGQVWALWMGGLPAT